MTSGFLVKFYPILTCRIIVSAPVPVPFLWTLDLGFGTLIWDLNLGLGFGTWIWDLDLGLGFATGLGLDNFCFSKNTSYLLPIFIKKPCSSITFIHYSTYCEWHWPIILLFFTSSNFVKRLLWKHWGFSRVWIQWNTAATRWLSECSCKKCLKNS